MKGEKMPRIARENLKTITKTYHIIIRGVNKQDLFFDDSDKEKYKKIVKAAKEKFEIKVQLYVMMSNHVHIVIQDEKEKCQILCIRYVLLMLCILIKSTKELDIYFKIDLRV